jgi:hypothetical protein
MYHIIFNNRSDGWSFDEDKSYNTIHEALKEAIAQTIGWEFRIIKVIQWKAIEKQPGLDQNEKDFLEEVDQTYTNKGF